MAATIRTTVSDVTLAPPMLTPEGAKVQPDWLYAFLQGPITIRPWLNVRMPTFGLDDGRWNAIIDYFEATGNSIGSFRTYNHAELTSMAGPGRELFDLLKCQQCHVLGAIPADQPVSNLAPDLRMTHERLEARVDSRLAAKPGQDSARHAHAPVLADAAVSEVVVPAARRRCRSADSSHQGSPDDAARRPEPEAAGDDEHELTT